MRARGLHYLTPELWPVMLVDDNGHAKGLPLNQRAGQLDGGEIAGEVVLCQEVRSETPTGVRSRTH